VARGLKQEQPYMDKLRRIAQDVEPTKWYVQSRARGNDDAQFYSERRISDSGNLRDILSSGDRPAVVLSVRLHGALESILNGVPAVHLSYERKGFGAYADLGIPDYCHNSYSFDADTVVEQVKSLRADPTDYWRAVDAQLAPLSEARLSLIAAIRNLVA